MAYSEPPYQDRLCRIYEGGQGSGLPRYPTLRAATCLNRFTGFNLLPKSINRIDGKGANGK